MTSFNLALELDSVIVLICPSRLHQTAMQSNGLVKMWHEIAAYPRKCKSNQTAQHYGNST